MFLDDFHTRMCSLASAQKLPESHIDDLNTDRVILEQYKGCDFVWLLRTCGTVLMPLKIGVDPVHVTHWFHSGTSQRVVPFFVSPEQNRIEMISVEKAEILVRMPPCDIGTLSQKSEVLQKVLSVLNFGCEKRIWGVFSPPDSFDNVVDLNSWKSYFEQCGNAVMRNTLDKALRVINR